MVGPSINMYTKLPFTNRLHIHFKVHFNDNIRAYASRKDLVCVCVWGGGGGGGGEVIMC